MTDSMSCLLRYQKELQHVVSPGICSQVAEPHLMIFLRTYVKPSKLTRTIQNLRHGSCLFRNATTAKRLKTAWEASDQTSDRSVVKDFDHFSFSRRSMSCIVKISIEKTLAGCTERPYISGAKPGFSANLRRVSDWSQRCTWGAWIHVETWDSYQDPKASGSQVFFSFLWCLRPTHVLDSEMGRLKESVVFEVLCMSWPRMGRFHASDMYFPVWRNTRRWPGRRRTVTSPGGWFGKNLTVMTCLAELQHRKIRGKWNPCNTSLKWKPPPLSNGDTALGVKIQPQHRGLR